MNGLGRVFAAFAKKWSGEFDRIAKKTIQLITDVEEEFGFDSGVKRVLVLPFDGGWYLGKKWPVIGDTLKVHDPRPYSRELKEFVYHELGHAIHDHFAISTYLKSFTRRRQATLREYRRVSREAAESERRPGFVSGYAWCNREEDFCETFSAYLCNRKTWRRRLRYDGAWLHPGREPRMERKFLAVHELLGDLHDFE